MANNLITWQTEKRIIKVFQGNKHVKSVPKIYEPIMDAASFNFDKKRLQESEVEVLNKILFPLLKDAYEKHLQQRQRYVFELIDSAEFLGVRTVVVFKGSERFEAVYKQNGIERAVQCDKDFFRICPDKLPTKRCNY